MKQSRRVAYAAILMTCGYSAAMAQQGPPVGWNGRAAAEFIIRGARDLDGGGSFAVSRQVIGGGVMHVADPRTMIGFGISAGIARYDFDDVADVWGDIHELDLSVPVTFGVTDATTGLVVPLLRYGGEEGVAFSDGQTAGVILGASWQANDRLSVGPGLGVVTTLDDSDYDVFPFLLVNWQVTDRLAIGNGDAFGGSRGPGIGMNYALDDTLGIGLFARSDETEFRLDDDGIAPGGVGRDKALAVVATVNWTPTPSLTVNGFAGAELGGTLTLRDADGHTVDKRDYDPAPILGAKIDFSF